MARPSAALPNDRYAIGPEQGDHRRLVGLEHEEALGDEDETNRATDQRQHAPDRSVARVDPEKRMHDGLEQYDRNQQHEITVERSGAAFAARIQIPDIGGVSHFSLQIMISYLYHLPRLGKPCGTRDKVVRSKGRTEMEIAGKLALVTGGTDGIGLWIARLLKLKGASVIVCGRRPALLESAAAEGFEAIAADLSSKAGVTALAGQMATRPLDIVVNNAGTGADYDLSQPIDLDATDRTIFLNLNAPIHLAALLVPRMKTRRRAALVNVTSGLAIAPCAGGPVYCATKAGLRSFSKAIRHQLRGTGVTVIEALPPVIETALTQGRPGKKMSAEACAREIVRAIERDRIEANVGQVKLLKLVHSISPRLAEAVMIRF
jgi:uncharacterized oxidoreductase